MNEQSKTLTNVAIGLGLSAATLLLFHWLLVMTLPFDAMSNEMVRVWWTSLNIVVFIGGIMLMAMLMLLGRVSVSSAFAGVMGTVFLVIPFSFSKMCYGPLWSTSSTNALYWLLSFPWLSVGLYALAKFLSERKRVFLLCVSMCMIGGWIVRRLVNIHVWSMVEKGAMENAVANLALHRLNLMFGAQTILSFAAIGTIWISRKRLAGQFKEVSSTSTLCGRVKPAYWIMLAVMAGGFALLRGMNFFDSVLFLIVALAFLLVAIYFLAKSIAPFVDRVVEGRIRRMRFFWLSLLAGACFLSVKYLVLPDSFTRSEFEVDPSELLLSLLTMSIWGIGSFCIWIKRAHDIGWSSKLAIWMLVFALLPFFGCLDVFIDGEGGGMLFWPFCVPYATLPVIILVLLFVPGTKGENKFGERK